MQRFPPYPDTLEESNRRLEVLASFMHDLEPKRFDFSKWVGKNWQGKPDLSCGTTACGMGWAATIPEFQKLGLRIIEVERTEEGYEGAVVLAPGQPAVDLPHRDSRYHGEPNQSATHAGMVVFGLTEDEFAHLFTPGYHLPLKDDADLDDGEDQNVLWGLDNPAHEVDGMYRDSSTPQQLAEHIRRFIQYRPTYAYAIS